MWSCSIFSSTSASCDSARDNVACSSALPVKQEMKLITEWKHDAETSDAFGQVHNC